MEKFGTSVHNVKSVAASEEGQDKRPANLRRWTSVESQLQELVDNQRTLMQEVAAFRDSRGHRCSHCGRSDHASWQCSLRKNYETICVAQAD